VGKTKRKRKVKEKEMGREGVEPRQAELPVLKELRSEETRARDSNHERS